MRHILSASAACLLAALIFPTTCEAGEEVSPLAQWTLDRKHVRGTRLRPSEGKLTGRIYGKVAISKEKPGALAFGGE